MAVPVGEFCSIERSGLVIRLEWRHHTVTAIRVSASPDKGRNVNCGNPAHKTVVAQFLAYLKTGQGKFRLPLDRGRLSSFQKKVFRALALVPAGRTVTYGELSEKVGGSRYRRAVAMALKGNPFPVVIPCHRVVAKHGVGGYSGGGGIPVKMKLLELEGACVRK